jgi:tetratricopeptide (TPR) repeat protein
MKRAYLLTMGAVLAMVLQLSLPGQAAYAQDQSTDQSKPAYTLAEYNAFQAARQEANPANRLKLLDDFVAKFPNSTLMPYVLQVYVDTYSQQKDYPKTIQAADKLVALGDKVAAQGRLQALVARCTAFDGVFNPKAPDAQDQLTKERDAAQQGLKLLDTLPKPDATTLKDFNESKKPAQDFFDNALGFALMQLKDFNNAATAYSNAIAANPKDAVAFYRLGVSDLQEKPPLSMDGFWALAEAIDLKAPGEAQVRTYLRGQIQGYQGTGCDDLLDAQLNELLTLAQSGGARPTSYVIKSTADLDAIRSKSTIITVFTALKAGGDDAKNNWLAVCGSEFQDVPGRIMDKTADPSGSIAFKVYTGSSQEEMDAATEPNGLVTIATSAQPGIERFEKGDYFRFSGTLLTYDPSPLLVHWGTPKINPDDIPKEAEAGKHNKKKP